MGSIHEKKLPKNILTLPLKAENLDDIRTYNIFVWSATPLYNVHVRSNDTFTVLTVGVMNTDNFFFKLFYPSYYFLLF